MELIITVLEWEVDRMLPRVELLDLVNYHKGVEVTNNKLVNIRGCNGSGKSTIPLSMKDSDEDTFEVVWQQDGKERVVATVFPNYEFIAIGKYTTKCGGMDALKTTDEIKMAVEVLWNMNYNILMEGIMASTVRQTYIDLFLQMNEEHELQREIIIYNILPPLNVCLNRIQQRNGGKPIKEELVSSKWKTVDNNVQHFKNAGFRSLKVSNEDITQAETLKWFFEQIEQSEIKDSNSKNLKTLHVEPKDSMKGIEEWFPWYKEPNNGVELNHEYLNKYWKFMYDRLEIYYKRVVLNQPSPWTDDPIFNEYRFTNISRDMDRLTIYERKHILSKLDEPTANLEIRKKSVMFNIILFRTFVKIDTYECFGFIDLESDNWRQQWNSGKKKLLKRREQGVRNFTGSFMVNTMKNCNSDKNTKDNQTMNGLCMCEWFLENLDEVYSKAIKKPKNMKEQLEYLKTLNGIGSFTAYELACSFAMAGRYFRNTLVPWSQDSYTSIGPGSAGGIEWIYKSLGNLSEIEAIIYLRSIWKYEMKRLGLYDNFVNMLPKVFNSEIDLRIVEHCLCEAHKYNKLSTKTGRTKQRFTAETTDTSILEV